MSLLVRRLLAFVLDLAPFIGVWTLLTSFRIVGLIDLPNWTDSAIYVVFFAFTGLLELLSGGRSLGKYIFGVAITSRDGSPLPRSSYLKRAALNAAIFPSILVLENALAAILGLEGSGLGFFVAFPVSALLFQSLLLVLTLGRVGLADLVLKSIARRSSIQDPVPKEFPVVRATFLAAGVAVILGVSVALSGSKLGELLVERLEATESESEETTSSLAIFRERLQGVLRVDTTPISLTVATLRPCTGEDAVEMDTLLPYLFVPLDAFPMSIADCWDVYVRADIRVLTSSDVRLALGLSAAATLKAESGPYKGKPRPTLIRVAIERRETTGFFSVWIRQNLIGYFVPEQTTPMVLFDSGFDAGIAAYTTESGGEL